MMAAEFDKFVELIRKLEKLYGKKGLDDETMQMYWAALKELSFPTFEKKVAEHIKRAKFFPKPAELRPREDAPSFEQSEKSRREFEMTEKRNMAFWDSELQTSLLATKWLILKAYEDRTVLYQEGSTEHSRRTEFALHARRNLQLESRGCA